MLLYLDQNEKIWKLFFINPYYIEFNRACTNGGPLVHLNHLSLSCGLTKTFIIKGAFECRGGGRHIGHKLRVGGDVGRYTRYSQVLTPYTEDWGNNKTAEWYAGKKVK